MNYLTLEQIKAQLRIDASYTEDDDLLNGLGDSAESFLEAHLNCALDDIAADNSGTLPQSLIQSLLMLVDYLYDHSGSGDRDLDIPKAFWVLCKPWQKYTIV